MTIDALLKWNSDVILSLTKLRNGMTYNQMEKYWYFQLPSWREIFYGGLIDEMVSFERKGHRYYKKKESDG